MKISLLIAEIFKTRCLRPYSRRQARTCQEQDDYLQRKARYQQGLKVERVWIPMQLSLEVGRVLQAKAWREKLEHEERERQALLKKKEKK